MEQEVLKCLTGTNVSDAPIEHHRTYLLAKLHSEGVRTIHNDKKIINRDEITASRWELTTPSFFVIEF